jgi:GT2 family glycosyltransferase
MKPITVIIPVYNAFDVTLDCVESVLRTIPRGVRVCVIDDASPSGQFQDVLPASMRRRRELTVLRNEKNLGFVGACNRGMLLESSGDVILLNSDTIVTKGWVQKLRRAAYSGERIGTVTPLTNNGTICSVPRFLENNTLPQGFTLEEFSRLIEEVSGRAYVEAPTCVGFCTYIRRQMIDEVGVFDPVFKQGYGEENDLSRRAKARGFANIIDDATFVYHRGNMSFKEMREALSRANTEILRQRYPDYEQSVAQFCSENPLSAVHSRIWNRLISRWLKAKKQSVLHVLHNGPFVGRRHGIGGTESHVQSITRHDTTSAHFSLTPGVGHLYLSAHTADGDYTLVLPETLLMTLIASRFFDLVHLHHAMGFDMDKLAGALQNHGNYVVSLHDYYLVCGHIWLSQPDGTVCDGLSCEGVCGESRAVGKHRRAVASKIFEGARRILVFSQSSRSILERTVGCYSTVQVVPHGVECARPKPLLPPPSPKPDVPLRIVAVGTFTAHKGSGFISRCAAEISTVRGAPIEWHFLGRDADGIPNVRNHGPFEPTNLRDKLADIGAHVSLLVPQCQETYSLTLDELVWSGLPVICSPFGALPERVKAWRVGYVSDNSITGMREILEQIMCQWDTHLEFFKNTQTAPIVSIEQEVRGYSEMYSQFSVGARAAPEKLIAFLQPDLCWHEPSFSLGYLRLKGRKARSNMRHALGRAETAVGLR